MNVINATDIHKRIDDQGERIYAALDKLTDAVNQCVIQSTVIEERCLGIIENNQERDKKIERLSAKIAEIEQTIGINKFIVSFSIRRYFALFGSMLAGGLAVFVYMTGIK